MNTKGNSKFINNVINDDCLIVMDYIEDKSIDMILCDLPYGKTYCDWDIIIPFDQLWSRYERIIKDSGVIVLTASQPFTSQLVCSNLKLFRYEWIWEKIQGTNPMLANVMPLKSHENILIFYKNKPVYNPQYEKGNPYKGFKSENNKTIGEVYGKLNSQHRDNPTGERFPKTVIKIPKETGLHPTQKPVKLFEYLIKTYTNKDYLILDNCAGSGTTGEACINLKRNYILIEKEKIYCDVINKRLKEVYNKHKFFEFYD